MAKFETDAIARMYASATDVIAVIDKAKTSSQSEQEYKDKIKRNVDHLELIKGYKQEDDTTSIWTTENFTAIDAAITKGKGLL